MLFMRDVSSLDAYLRWRRYFPRNPLGLNHAVATYVCQLKAHLIVSVSLVLFPFCTIRESHPHFCARARPSAPTSCRKTSIDSENRDAQADEDLLEFEEKGCFV